MAAPLAPWYSSEVHMYCICAARASHKLIQELPILLLQAIDVRISAISKKIRFSYCDVKEVSKGGEEVDVLIFPNMVQYKGLTASDVESFVEEVVVQGNEWTAKKPEKITAGVHVFVCARSVVGESKTPLSDIFINEVAARELDQVMVSKCTHIYGEKYTGNVVVYTPSFDGEYAEHCWYDYVTERYIPVLLDEFLSKGKPIEKNLWQLSKEKAEAGTMPSFSSFASWIKENVPWSALAAAGVMGALVGFSLSKKLK